MAMTSGWGKGSELFDAAHRYSLGRQRSRETAPCLVRQNRAGFAAVFACQKPHFPAAKFFLRFKIRFKIRLL